MNVQQIRVQTMANLLAKADHETVERISRGRNFTSAELEELVENYGQQLLPLPGEALDDLEAPLHENADDVLHLPLLAA